MEEIAALCRSAGEAKVQSSSALQAPSGARSFAGENSSGSPMRSRGERRSLPKGESAPFVPTDRAAKKLVFKAISLLRWCLLTSSAGERRP